MFQLDVVCFYLDVVYVAATYMYVASVCSKYFTYFRCMLQLFYLNVIYVAVIIHICCTCIFQLFHLIFSMFIVASVAPHMLKLVGQPATNIEPGALAPLGGLVPTGYCSMQSESTRIRATSIYMDQVVHIHGAYISSL
jgi:hypothetical protein